MRYRWKSLTAVAVGVALAVVYHKLVRPWHLHWGMTEEELCRSWPGDELVPDPCTDQSHAMTMHAPAAAIWPWIVQIGQDRGGFYSYTQLENLVGCQMKNADRIVPEWQERKVGDMVWMTPQEKFGGRGRMEIALLEPNRAMILIPPRDVPPELSLNGGVKATWGFILEPIEERSTRVIMRARTQQVPRLRNRVIGYGFWEPAHFVMERKMMLTIKRRVEST
jgi:hypothetical protein